MRSVSAGKAAMRMRRGLTSQAQRTISPVSSACFADDFVFLPHPTPRPRTVAALVAAARTLDAASAPRLARAAAADVGCAHRRGVSGLCRRRHLGSVASLDGRRGGDRRRGGDLQCRPDRARCPRGGFAKGVPLLGVARSPARGFSADECADHRRRPCVGGGAGNRAAGHHIGAGAVVGAGSVVTRDVAPGCTVAGNPARVVRAAEAVSSSSA